VDESRDDAEKKERSLYWVVCPACGRQVVKKRVVNQGVLYLRLEGQRTVVSDQ